MASVEPPLQRPGRHVAIAGLRGGADESSSIPSSQGTTPEWAEGKLAQLTALTFEQSLPWLRHVRTHGVMQFISIFHRSGGVRDDTLLWGDEIEYMLVQLDANKRSVCLSLRGEQVLQELQDKESTHARRDGFGEAASWHPEYAGWMLEGTPRNPYGGFTTDLRRVEQNMRLRRTRIASSLRAGEAVLTMPAFPLLGVGDFCTPSPEQGNAISRSNSLPDSIITANPRFLALTRNIRHRRGSKVDIRVPMLREPYTSPDELAKGIQMDAMGYGMGCCCLQVTFQARDVDESRHLYDHLAVLSPVLLAATAATPVLHGRLASTDVRWNTISSSVDDRTPAERGESATSHDYLSAEQIEYLAGGGKSRLPKSRYDSISLYLAHCSGCHDKYNDLNPPIHKESFRLLHAAGIDTALARHVAHLFVRDPLVIHKERIELNDALETDHFENLQSTNWQTVRWKPPPKRKPNAPHIGWRVEFRSMEVQLTDFENAAYTVFVVLVSRVILAFDLNLYIPLSKVDENMERAHAGDAVNRCKFYFRKHLAPPQERVGDPDGFEEMSVSEIMSGKGDYFPGLIPLIFAYLDAIQCDAETYEQMRIYLDFIRRRASGELQTAAQWMRSFIRKHDDYRHDSKLPPAVAHDLVQACIDIAEGRRHEPRLLGENRISPLRVDDAWDVPLKARRKTILREERDALLARYVQRSSH
eukprot:CAMPEP_0119346040 /NCGR_PEP_ID=MMETSP1333-20130426/107801_1 /TAXON_ID=418940 /ORGANISM="Scyphosphaera apsteinii, Strain RCC1455" /LENGTH=699 /DNA_ID=CAMNT_0007358535 /DNA_START=74 /DNA_END=2173 /DNA_ORIENTATION=+